MRWAAVAAVALVLAACSGVPKKSQPSPPGGAAGEPAAGAGQPRRSPYPPAEEDPSKRGDYVSGGLYAPHISDSAPDYIPDVDAIPEPEVVDEPRSRYGNRSPYAVLGKHYTVLDEPAGFVEQGVASYYGNKFHGRRTSNMEVYDMYAFTAAHKSLPLPSFARVTNLDNGRSVVVRVNDRGPFHEGRVVDLSWAAAVKLDIHRQGTGRVEVRALSPGEEARHAHGAVAASTGAAAVPEIAEGADPAYAHDRRFNMMQGGRVMTADDFDAWLEERQIDLRAVAAVAAADTPPAVAAAVQPAGSGALPEPAPPAMGDGVTLQVAAFGARANAERALATLLGAGIPGARLVDGSSGGKAMWRLHVGPVAAGLVPELSARFSGLGFGQPQVVRD